MRAIIGLGRGSGRHGEARLVSAVLFRFDARYAWFGRLRLVVAEEVAIFFERSCRRRTTFGVISGALIVSVAGRGGRTALLGRCFGAGVQISHDLVVKKTGFGLKTEDRPFVGLQLGVGIQLVVWDGVDGEEILLGLFLCSGGKGLDEVSVLAQTSVEAIHVVLQKMLIGFHFFGDFGFFAERDVVRVHIQILGEAGGLLVEFFDDFAEGGHIGADLLKHECRHGEKGKRVGGDRYEGVVGFDWIVCVCRWGAH